MGSLGGEWSSVRAARADLPGGEEAASELEKASRDRAWPGQRPWASLRNSEEGHAVGAPSAWAKGSEAGSGQCTAGKKVEQPEGS